MKKIQLCLMLLGLCGVSEIVHTNFPTSGGGTITIINRSNTPIAVYWQSTSNTGNNWTASIAPGATDSTSFAYGSTLIYIKVIYLNGGTVTANQTDATAFIQAQDKYWIEKRSSDRVPKTIIVYGDGTVAPGRLLSKASQSDTNSYNGVVPPAGAMGVAPGSGAAATGSASGQLLLPQNSLSKFIAIIYGDVTAATESTSAPALNVVMSALDSNGAVYDF